MKAGFENNRSSNDEDGFVAVRFYDLPTEMRIMSVFDSLDMERRGPVYSNLIINGRCWLDVLTGDFAARGDSGSITMVGSMVSYEYVRRELTLEYEMPFYVNYYDSYGYIYNDQDAVIDGTWFDGNFAACEAMFG